MDEWVVADAAPGAGLLGVVEGYRWWRERTGSFDARRELASTRGVFIVNLGAPLEVTDVGGRTLRLGAGEAFVGGMAQGNSVSRSCGAMEGVHVNMPIETLARAMGVGVGDLGDRAFRLDEVLGREGEAFLACVMGCRTVTEKLDVLDGFLARRLAGEGDGVLGRVMEGLRTKPAGVVAEEMGWSRKYLARWVRDRIGMLPREFGRLARFERFTDALQKTPEVGLAALACDAGYVDQAHLTHDVQRLAGVTPGALRAALLPEGGGVRA